MDLANIDNNVAVFPNPTQLQDPGFLSSVFFVTTLSSLLFEIFKMNGKVRKMCKMSRI